MSMELQDASRNGKEESMMSAEGRKRQKTPKEYACEVLGLSLLNGVPNIIAVKRTRRKIFKIVVLAICGLGFLIQAVQFISFMHTYPSVVDIQVYTPKQFMSPAYTFCNSNGIKRSKFCAKYPFKCYKPRDINKFCNMYPYFCEAFKNKDDIELPKREFYDFEKNITFSELKELGHDIRSLKPRRYVIDFLADDDDPLATFVADYDDDPEEFGPIPVRKLDGTLILCYSMYLRVNSSRETHMVNKPDKYDKVIKDFEFDLEPREIFVPFRRAGGYFHIHSPFTFKDPFEESVFIKYQYDYMVHVKLQEEILLPAPYKSDCINYTEIWEKKGRKGVRSEESCNQLCNLESVMKYCNCTYPEIGFPTELPYCNATMNKLCADDLEKLAKALEDLEKCEELCKNDCHQMKFSYTHQVRFKEDDPESTKDKDHVSIKVFASDPDVVRYEYRPQYQNIEAFSYIGGFVGVWLGVSLVAVIDFGESLFLIVNYYIRYRKNYNECAN